MFKCEICGNDDFKRGNFKGRKVWECKHCHMCYDASFFEETKEKDSYYKDDFERYQHYKIATRKNR